MKCIIIDDEKFSREILSIMVLKSPDLVLENEFENAIQAIKYLNENNDVDLIFLDIHMPNFSGFDFIKTVNKLPQIIFVTSDKNFAIDAFNYDCITDYLLKPITENRFEKAIQKAKFNKYKFLKPVVSNVEENIKEFYVNIDKRLIKIDMSTIKYIMANGDYVIIKTDTINYTVHTTLKKIEEKLPKFIFLKTHRSYIINLNKIVDIQGSNVLIGNDVIPISKTKRPILIELLYLL